MTLELYYLGTLLIFESLRTVCGQFLFSAYSKVLNLVQVQKWSFALEKTTDFELDLVYGSLNGHNLLLGLNQV